MAGNGARCDGCGGLYRYDISIPSDLWNMVIRANRLPDYLCGACIIREFASRGESFTARLYGDGLDGLCMMVQIAPDGPPRSVCVLPWVHEAGVPEGYDAICHGCGYPFTAFNAHLSDTRNPLAFCCRTCERSSRCRMLGAVSDEVSAVDPGAAERPLEAIRADELGTEEKG